jgi:hypothetical protein
MFMRILHIEDRLRYQNVCANVTSDNIEDRQNYQIVCENITSKRGRDIKWFMQMLHRREAEISNCSSVNVTSKTGRDIKMFV